MDGSSELGVTGDDSQGTSLAYRLSLLFEVVHPQGRGPWTANEVGAGIRARGGQISDVYVWQLKTGRRTNPSRQTLQDLADFFDIDPAYFFDDRQADEILRDLHALRAVRQFGVRRVAARLGELAGHDPAAMGELIDQVMRALQAREDGASDDSGRGPT